MATSKCPKCENTTFELVEGRVDKSTFKIMFIQCSSCGAVVGTTDYYNTPDLIHKLAKSLNVKL